MNVNNHCTQSVFGVTPLCDSWAARPALRAMDQLALTHDQLTRYIAHLEGVAAFAKGYSKFKVDDIVYLQTAAKDWPLHNVQAPMQVVEVHLSPDGFYYTVNVHSRMVAVAEHDLGASPLTESL